MGERSEEVARAMVKRSEEMARALVAQLHAVGIDARLNVLEWHVDAGVGGSRALRVRCVQHPSSSERTPAMKPRPSNARAMLVEAPGARNGSIDSCAGR